MNIDCQDVYNLIDLLVKSMDDTKDTTKMIKTMWENIPTSDNCKPGGKLSTICQLISYFLPSLKQDPTVKPIIDKIEADAGKSLEDLITPGCNDFLSQCQPTFCSKGVDPSTWKILCKDVNTAITMILSDDEVRNFLIQNNVSPISFCLSLQQLVDNIGFEGVTKLIIDKVNDNTGDYSNLLQKYVDQIPALLQCICPGIKDKLPSHVTPPTTTNKYSNKYNTKLILGIFVVLLLISLIPISIVLLTARRNKGLYVGIILLFVVLILSIIVLVNHKCMIKSCLKAGGDWVPIQGKYRGSVSMVGITVKADLEFLPEDEVNINVLSCDGNGCPSKNMIADCKEYNKVVINPNKTDYGYVIEGPCMDKIMQIKTKDVSVKGFWFIRENDKVKMQILLNSKLIGNLSLVVPLKKQS